VRSAGDTSRGSAIARNAAAPIAATAPYVSADQSAPRVKSALQLVGLDKFASALPRARIIHLVRDPMDTCYAVFKTLFNQAYSYSYDLDELADYYIAHRRLMDHWHRVLPGAILDVAYEDIVADQEREARRILAWCDLGWEPAVLEFYRSTRDSTTASAAQVRGPVYASSVGKWRNYSNELAGLHARLAAAGVLTAHRAAST